MFSSFFASNFYQPCNSFHRGDNVWHSLINHSLNTIKKTQKEVVALNFWVHWERPQICQEGERVCVGDREMGGKCARVCVIFSRFDLAHCYSLLPAVKCAAVMAPPPETRRQTEGGFPLSEGPWWVLESPLSLRSSGLCKQETKGEGGEGRKEGAEDNEHRKEKEGGEKKVSGTVREREGGRQRKTGRAVIIKSLTHSYCSGYSTELRGM